MNRDFNLPPGTTLRDIERHENPSCEECGEPLLTDEEVRMGLCKEHLDDVRDALPE